jgi:hypothetical protein
MHSLSVAAMTMLRGKAGAGHKNHAHLSAVQENVSREVTTAVMCVIVLL